MKRFLPSVLLLLAVVVAVPGVAARQKPGTPALVVIITHETTEEAIRQAVDAIEQDGQVSERPQVIRIEKLGEGEAS